MRMSSISPYSLTHAVRVLAVCAISAALACSGTTDATKGPDVLRAAAGEGQTGVAGLHLRDSLSVKLLTSSGDPRATQYVRWTVATGGGSVFPPMTATDANGVTSTSWKLGTVGEQTVVAQVDESAIPPVAFTATAVAPVVAIRYDGTTWHTELADTNLARIRLAGIWGSSPTSLFAVGTWSTTGPLTLRLNNGSWGSARTISISPSGDMRAISGRTMTDVYTTRNWALPPSGGREIAHYDGQNWTASYTDNCSFSCLDAVNSLWVSASPDVFAVGFRGLVLHYDGSVWGALASGTAASLNGVWGSAPDHVLAVGDNGTILLYDGKVWTPQVSGVTETLNGIWGTSASNVFVVGNHGTVLHFDGATWSRQNANTTEDLYAISGSAGHVFAVGNNSTVVQYDGSRWLAQPFSIPIDLRGIWASGNEAVAVGAPPSL